MKLILMALSLAIVAGCASQRVYLSEKLTPTHIEIDAREMQLLVEQFSTEYHESRNLLLDSNMPFSPLAIQRLESADISIIYAAGKVAGIAGMQGDKSTKLTQRQLYEILRPVISAAKDVQYVYEDYSQSMSDEEREQHAGVIADLNDIILITEQSFFEIQSELDLLQLLSKIRAVVSTFK